MREGNYKSILKKIDRNKVRRENILKLLPQTPKLHGIKRACCIIVLKFGVCTLFATNNSKWFSIFLLPKKNAMGKHRASRKKIETEHDTENKTVDFECEKEEKLLNLLAEIVIKSTLKEFYETCDQVSVCL